MEKHLTLVLLLIALFCRSLPAAAQEYRAFARRYTVEDGLPNRLVHHVMQDHRGFIWAATDGGVVRFDGRRFKVFNQADNGLHSDIIGSVSEDADGNIWAIDAHFTAIDIINPLSGQITPVDSFLKDKPFPVPFQRLARPPFNLPDGTLVFNLDYPGGWLTYHPKRGWNKVELPDCDIFDILCATPTGTFWGTFDGRGPNVHAVVEIDEHGNTLKRIPARLQYAAKSSVSTPAYSDKFLVFELSDHEKGDNTLFKFDLLGNKNTVFSNINRNVLQFLQTGQDQNVVMFPQILDKNGQIILDLSKQFPELDINQSLWACTDQTGNIWFATAFGLVVVEIRKDHFKRLLFDQNAPGGRGYACRGLIEKNGLLTVNTENFIKSRFLIDLKTGKETQLPGSNSFGIAPSADGNIWTEIGLAKDNWWFTSVLKTSPDGKPLGPALLRPQMNAQVTAMFEEKPDRVLIGGGGWGIIIYNPQTGQHEPFQDPAYPEFSKSFINCLGWERSGFIGVCTSAGYYRLKPGGGILGRYWSKGTGAFKFPYDNLLNFYEDAGGVFWIGTGGAGLMQWKPDKKDQPASLLFHKNGLLNGKIYAVYEDAHQHLWLPTDYGIAQFDKTSLQMRHTWLTSEGLTHNEFNRGSHWRGSDGALYFGGLNGITTFYPDEFYHSDINGSKGLTLAVSDFRVFKGESGQLENQTADLLQNNRITLHPTDRYFQLEFALLEFLSPEKVSYSWKMDDFTADWTPLNEAVLRLSSLPSGIHRLHVRAQASDGSWAQNELDIIVDVIPPFYLRWWFLLTMAMLISLGIWGWIRWRTRELTKNQAFLESEIERKTTTIRKQTEALKALDEAKNRFFANISHELRTPLTLMLGPLDAVQKRNQLNPVDQRFVATAQKHSRELLNLVNEILDLSKLESGKMELHEISISLQPFIQKLVRAYESHAERLGIRLRFQYLAADRLRVFVDAEKLQKVLNNLISNALKFTPRHADGAVTVRVEAPGGHILIEVEDNGRGIHPLDLPHIFDRFYQSNQPGTPIEGGTGIGLAYSREIAALFQGQVWAESAPGVGSHFYFKFPKKEAPDHAKTEATGDQTPDTYHTALEPSQAAPAENAGNKPIVLLVEDNDNLREYIRILLTEQYRVMEAENGKQALDLLADTTPDLIVSDIMMPVMDGFQFLETVKTDEKLRTIPFVMLTARADLRDKLHALRIGVDDYLVKPFEEAELQARIENLLRNARARATEQLISENPETQPQDEPALTLHPEDGAWLEHLEKIVLDSLDDSRLNAEWLAQHLYTSRNMFFKKVKLLTGMTPNDYIQTVRFTRARYLLETRASRTVKEAAYVVGVKDVRYFSAVFRKHFGKLPSEYLP
ncbi:MAG: ATP-binding protein [Bacteroidota bacterium]